MPGTPLHSPVDARHLNVGTARSAAQYVRADASGDLVPVRDLVAEADEGLAYDLRRTITLGDVARLLGVMLDEQVRPEVSYHVAAGRLYARYERHDADWRGVGLPPMVECLHVFVLSGSPAEA
ncbi:hypothetical protein AB0N09_06000 [Streptomyces erythrochromogenes]|uniref:hypothetical protein n=1 Tax=Streptomyces erythrochromogenes TaxID=285574 RepID=UPI00343B9BC9